MSYPTFIKTTLLRSSSPTRIHGHHPTNSKAWISSYDICVRLISARVWSVVLAISSV